MAALLQPSGDRCQQVGDLSRHPGGARRRIETLGVVPDRGQPLPHLGVAQVVEHDPVARPVGKLGVGFSGAGEIRIDLDAIADVGDEQEGRPVMVDRQRLGVTLCLALGLHHRLGPARRAAPRRTALQSRRCGLAEQVEILFALFRRCTIGFAALLSLKDEGALLVAINPAEAFRPVAIVLEHPSLEHVVVLSVVHPAALRRLDADKPAQAVDEALRVRQLGPARVAPLGDKCFDFLYSIIVAS